MIWLIYLTILDRSLTSVCDKLILNNLTYLDFNDFKKSFLSEDGPRVINRLVKSFPIMCNFVFLSL